MNRVAAKAAAQVKAGDRIEAFIERPRTLEVVTVIEKRVAAPVASACYVDHSPPPPPRQARAPRRPRGAGRPTKRERREVDRLRG